MTDSSGRVWKPTGGGWWVLLVAALFVIAAWPPDNDRSVLVKLVNWGVDPLDRLPILPPQLSLGLGDDVQAVEARDALVRRYDEFHGRGGWTRKRLELKVARDPFNPSTERQILLGIGAITAFVVWRFAGRAQGSAP